MSSRSTRALHVPDYQLRVSTPKSAEHLVRRFGELLADVRPDESAAEYFSRLGSLIDEHLAAMLELLEGVEAFDVIDLMRQYALPFTLDGFRESESARMEAAIDLVAVLVTAREDKPGPGSAANLIIEELHQHAAAIIGLSALRLQDEAERGSFGPLRDLAAQYVSHRVTVRNMQFLHIADLICRAIFDDPAVKEVIKKECGFSFTDFIEVRQAINDIYVGRYFSAADALREVATRWSEGGRVSSPREDVAVGRAAAEALFARPGARAAFDVKAVTDQCHVGTSEARAILNMFSLELLSSFEGPVEAADLFLRGGHDVFGAQLVRRADHFVSLGSPIGTDSLRQKIEGAIKAGEHWPQYDRARARVTERLTVEALERLLGTSASYERLFYIAPKSGVAASALSRKATAPYSFGNQAEADALFLIDDVAICVEVKARSISDGAKRGSVLKLTTDLEKTVGDAVDQGYRLDTLITENGGLWKADRTWLDLSAIREVRSIAVVVDDVGPAGIAVDELVRAGVVTVPKLAWITTLHDLIVISEVSDRPAEFLLYLRRRTDPRVARKFRAVDELDLFMLFMTGGLYSEADPDEVFKEYPTSNPPSARDRRKYAADQVLTRVSTLTDSLDRWVYGQEGTADPSSPKPIFGSNGIILKRVDQLRARGDAGAFRFGADLLNLSGEAQDELAAGIRNLRTMVKADGSRHSLVHCWAGMWGFPMLALGISPAADNTGQNWQHLKLYSDAKKYQLKADRAMTILFDEHLAIINVGYENDAPSDSDPVMDELVREMKLHPVGASPRPVPPSAKRSTKRLRKQTRH